MRTDLERRPVDVSAKENGAGTRLPRENSETKRDDFSLNIFRTHPDSLVGRIIRNIPPEVRSRGIRAMAVLVGAAAIGGGVYFAGYKNGNDAGVRAVNDKVNETAHKDQIIQDETQKHASAAESKVTALEKLSSEGYRYVSDVYVAEQGALVGVKIGNGPDHLDCTESFAVKPDNNTQVFTAIGFPQVMTNLTGHEQVEQYVAGRC